jgi:DNA-binding response OmpR family regulator
MPEPRIEAHPVTEATPKTATAPTGTTDLAGRSLLIVEDESVLRMSLARYCTRQGLVVLEAADADSARTVIAEKHPDFVLLDLHFPGGGGVAVLQTIGEHHEALLPRTILMSGDLDGGASKWIGGGYARVLTKPFEPRVLIDILRTIPL